jgi:hypothetical protein
MSIYVCVRSFLLLLYVCYRYRGEHSHGNMYFRLSASILHACTKLHISFTSCLAAPYHISITVRSALRVSPLVACLATVSLTASSAWLGVQ